MSNTQPLFSILHTSIRPHEWQKVQRAWMENAHDPASVEYVLVVDHDWGFDHLPGLYEKDWTKGLRYQDKAIWQTSPHHCYVTGVNLAASHSTGKILVVNADDQYPCKNWDLELLEAVQANEPGGLVGLNQDFIILPSTGTKDEHIRKLAVMPILSRIRYEKHGYVLFPMYESMFADNDFLAHARHDKAVVEAKHLLFPHLHPFNDNIPMSEWDDGYKAQNSKRAYHTGYTVFEARQNTKFSDDLSKPYIPAQTGHAHAHTPEPVQPLLQQTRKTLAICLPGESYSMEWVAQWTETLCQLAPFYNIMPIFSYTTNVYTTRESLFAAAAQVKPDYIIWIDDDNIVAPGQIQKLLEGLANNLDVDVVAGWCWLRSNAYDVTDRVSCGWWDGVKAKVYTYNDIFSTDGPDLREVGWTGFPVVVTRGDISNKLPLHPFLPILSNDYPHGHSGEDVAFCRQEHNLSIFVDRTVKVIHLKRKPDEPAHANNSHSHNHSPASTVEASELTPV